MTVIFGPSPITLHAGQTISPAVQVADNVSAVKVTLTHWNGQNQTDCRFQQSFDGGTTWRDRAAVGTQSAPSGTFKNRLDLWVGCEIWWLCGFTFPANSRYRPGQVCGEAFLASGVGVQQTVHSDWAFQDTTPLPDLSSINFHTPFPPTGLPLRQVRVVCNATGNINSQLIVETTP